MGPMFICHQVIERSRNREHSSNMWPVLLPGYGNGIYLNGPHVAGEAGMSDSREAEVWPGGLPVELLSLSNLLKRSIHPEHHTREEQEQGNEDGKSHHA